MGSSRGPSILSTRQPTPDYHLPPPEVVRHDKRIRVWWKPDQSHASTRRYYTIFFRSTMFAVSPSELVLGQFWATMVNTILGDELAAARRAGLRWKLEVSGPGITLNIHGVDDKIDRLLKDILLNIVNFKFSRTQFLACKDGSLADIRKKIVADPGQRAISDWMPHVYITGLASLEKSTQILEAVSLDRMRAFSKSIFDMVFVEFIAVGDLSRTNVLRTAKSIEDHLGHWEPLSVSQWPVIRTFDLSTENTEYVWKTQSGQLDSSLNAVVCHFYVDPLSALQYRAAAMLLENIIKAPFSVHTRTMPQPGFVARSVWDEHDRGRQYLLVQSTDDVDYIEEQMETFLTAFERDIRAISRSQFEDYRTGLIDELMARPFHPHDFITGIVPPIIHQTSDFDRFYNVVKELENLTRQDVLRYYRTYIKSGGEARVKATVQVLAQRARSDPPQARARRFNQDVRDARLMKHNIVRKQIENVADFQSSMKMNISLQTFEAMQEFVDPKSRNGRYSQVGADEGRSSVSGAAGQDRDRTRRVQDHGPIVIRTRREQDRERGSGSPVAIRLKVEERNSAGGRRDREDESRSRDVVSRRTPRTIEIPTDDLPSRTEIRRK